MGKGVSVRQGKTLIRFAFNRSIWFGFDPEAQDCYYCYYCYYSRKLLAKFAFSPINSSMANGQNNNRPEQSSERQYILQIGLIILPVLLLKSRS
jgi:hypothetical protein